MENKSRLHVYVALLSGILAFFFSACETATPTSTPTPEWRPLPTFLNKIPTSTTSDYRHYTPSENFDFRLEFDYPSRWLLIEYVNEIGSPNVLLEDPRFLTLPTPAPPEYHPTPTDYGKIAIWIVPDEPDNTPDAELASLKQAYSETWWMTVLSDYTTTIDGRSASVLEYLTDDPEGPFTTVFNRRIFFMINNQIYEIIYTIAEKDRGHEFDRGYEYFLKSIKIVP